VFAQGIELGVGAAPVPGVDIRGHLTYVRTDIVGSAQQLRNRPRWRGGLKLGWRPISKLLLSSQLLFVGRVFDSSIPTGDRTLASYARIDTAATYTLHRRIDVTVTIDNVTDAAYEEAVGFPAPGRTVRAGLRLRF
jgi:iron complex outermembrane receptor protein/vitamin B12 transporter